VRKTSKKQNFDFRCCTVWDRPAFSSVWGDDPSRSCAYRIIISIILLAAAMSTDDATVGVPLYSSRLCMPCMFVWKDAANEEATEVEAATTKKSSKASKLKPAAAEVWLYTVDWISVCWRCCFLFVFDHQCQLIHSVSEASSVQETSWPGPSKAHKVFPGVSS